MGHHHHKKRNYSWKQFVKDTSKPFITVERDINGVTRDAIHAFGKVGSSLGTSIFIPLVLVGGAALVFIVVNKSKT